MNHDVNGLEQILLTNARGTEETASLKKLLADMQTPPLLKLMQKHELRDIFKHHIASETADPHNNVIKRTYLVRQFHFKSKNNEMSKNDHVPVSTRTRRVTVELIKINGVKCIISNCDCCYVKRECHSCLHAQFTLDLLPTSEFVHPKC